MYRSYRLRRFVSIVLTILLVLGGVVDLPLLAGAVNVYADDSINVTYETVEDAAADGFTLSESSSSFQLKSYTGESQSVVLPSEVAGKKVTSVAEGAFTSNLYITDVVIPQSYTNVARFAFKDCTNLNTAEIYGDCINNYSTYPWASGCVLDRVYLGPDVTLYSEREGRVSVRSYEVDPANENYYSQDGIVYQKANDYLTIYPIARDDTVFSAEIKGLGDYAFHSAYNLTEVNLTCIDGCYVGDTSYTGFTFNDCVNLETFTATDAGSFNMIFLDGCTNLKTISVTGTGKAKAQLSGIGKNVNVEEVNIGDGFTQVSMGSSSYDGFSIDTVNLGPDVKEYTNPSYGFDWLGLVKRNIKTLNIDPDNPDFAVSGKALMSKDGAILYSFIDGSDEGGFSIPEGVQKIYQHAFANTALTHVVIPDSVTTIGDYAFSYMANLISIHIPDSVTEIGAYVFPRGTIIYGTPGSVAEEYAINNNFSFKSGAQMEADISTKDYGTSVWDDSDPAEEIVPVSDTYVIQKASQLAWLASAVNSGKETFKGKTVKLAADIDLNGIKWTPIGNKDHSFYGDFDGQNHSITGLNIDSQTRGGLFGYVMWDEKGQSHFIKNLRLKKVTIKDSDDSGALAASVTAGADANNVVISNIKVTGKAENVKAFGGVISAVYACTEKTQLTISKCTVKMDITARSGESASGIVHYLATVDSYGKASASTLIEECKYKGVINTSGRYGNSAGIVTSISDRYSNLTIRRCVTDGELTSGPYVNHGGIASSTVGSTVIESCLNLADVKGGYNVGGITGDNSGIIRMCENDGYVEMSSTMCPNAGIVGRNGGTVEDCVNLGHIRKQNYSGGIAGENWGVINRCYNGGPSTADDDGSGGLWNQIGGIAAWTDGDINYSYADVPWSANSILSGLTQDAQSPFLYECKEYSTAQMKTESNFVTWDFNSVWEFDSLLCYGYPVLTSIKDLLPHHPDRGSDKASKTKGQFFVVDQDGDPLADAEVVYGTDADAVSGTTDVNGSVLLAKKEERTGLKVSHDGYVTYENEDFVLPKTSEYTIMLHDLSKLDPYQPISAMMNYNDNLYDLMFEEKSLNRSFKNTEFTIDFKLADPATEVDHYEIIQPAAKDDAIATSNSGHFKLILGDFEVTEKKNKVRPIKVRVVDKNGDKHDTKINLQIVNETDVELSSLEFGDDLTIHIDDNVPFYGGTDLNLTAMSMPVIVKIAEDEWEVCINVGSFNNQNEKKKFKWEFTEIEGNVTEQREKFDEVVSKYAKEKGKSVVNNPKVELEFLGYASGDLPLTGDQDIDLKLYVGLSVGATKEWQGPYLIVVALDVKGTLFADGKIKIKHYTQTNVSDGYSGWDWEGAKMDLGFKPSGQLSLLLGAAYVASAGIYGHAEFMIMGELFTSQSGFTEVSLTGDAGLTVRFLGKQAIKVPIFKAKSPYYFYRRDTSTIRRLALRSKSLLASLQDASEVNEDFIARGSYTPSADTWSGAAETIADNTYPDLMPKMISAGGKTVMLFLDDGDTSRANPDKSMLMYSAYDKETGSWSAPQPVWDDGTADYTFNTYSDGTRAYVVWSNSKGSLTEESSTVEVGRQTEIAFAEFDGTGFVNTSVITSNNAYEIQPEVTSVSGTPYVTWRVNSEEDVLGASGTNTIYMAKGGSSWQISEITSSDAYVANQKIGEISGKPYIAYALMDGTSGACHPYIAGADGNVAALTDAAAFNIGFTKVSGDSVVFWSGSDGVIHTADAAGSEVAAPEASVGGIIRNIVYEAGEVKAMLYTVSGDNKSNAYAVIYDSGKKVWSDPIVLTDVAENIYVEELSGVVSGGKLLVTYNQRSLDYSNEEDTGVNSLRQTSIDLGKSHLRVTDADYNEFDLTEGADLPVTLKIANTGTSAADTVKITAVSADNGTTYFDQTVDLVVPAGSEAEKEITLAIPQNFAEDNVVFNVTDTGNSDTYEDSSLTKKMGQAVLSVELKKYCYGNKFEFVASVINDGYGTASGTVEFYDMESDETLVEYDFRNLKAGEIQDFRSDLPSLDLNEINVKGIGVRIVEADEDVILGNTDRQGLIANEATVRVRSVALDKYSAQLSESEPTVQLTASVTPDDADNQLIHWKTEDGTIALVDQNGLVTAVSGGTTRIYAYTDDGNKAAYCRVTVDMPKRIKILRTDESLEVGQFSNPGKIGYTFSPADASADRITWMVEDPAIAKVTDDGKVFGLRAGTTNVTISADGLQRTCKVTVNRDYENIYTEEAADINSNNRDRFYYVAHDPDTKYMRITFDDGTRLGSYVGTLRITDLFSNAREFTEDDQMYGKSVLVKGNAVLFSFDDSSDYYRFGVKSIEEITDDTVRVDNGSISIAQLKEKQLPGIELIPQPEEGSASWTSSDDSIASVDSTGYVTAYLPGEADITYSCDYCTSVWHVTVKEDKSIVIADSVDDLRAEGPYDDAVEEYKYIYAAKDPDTNYLKVTLAPECTMTGDTFMVLDYDGYEYYMSEYDYSPGPYYIAGNELQIIFFPEEGETGGFRVESVEELDKLPIDSFSCEQSEIKMSMGEYYSVDFAVEPYEFYDFITSSLICEIDDESIVSYSDSYNELAAEGVGSTNVTFYPPGYEDMAQTIKVTVVPAEFEIDEDYDYKIVNGEITPSLSVYDSNRYWYELDEGYDYIVSIDGGKVTVTGIGDYEGCVRTITLKNEILVTKVKLTGTSYISNKIAVGKTVKLKATVSPSDATNKTLKWKSSNTKYAKVTSTGKVTVLKACAGKTVTITASATDGSGKKATYKITGMKNYVKKIKLKASASSVKAGKSVTVKATVTTSGKKVNKTLKWVSSNTKYATVSSKGKVTAKKAGKGKTIKITAYATDGTGKKATIKLKIK